MSHAFVKEEDDQWLDQIPPTINALIMYLTRENNGIPSYVKRTYTDNKTGKEVHEMSNGIGYSIDKDGHWFMVDN